MPILPTYVTIQHCRTTRFSVDILWGKIILGILTTSFAVVVLELPWSFWFLKTLIEPSLIIIFSILWVTITAIWLSMVVIAYRRVIPIFRTMISVLSLIITFILPVIMLIIMISAIIISTFWLIMVTIPILIMRSRNYLGMTESVVPWLLICWVNYTHTAQQSELWNDKSYSQYGDCTLSGIKISSAMSEDCWSRQSYLCWVCSSVYDS